MEARHLHLSAPAWSRDDRHVPPIRIVIVDDHRIFLETVAMRLRAEPDLQVLAAESDPKQLLDADLARRTEVALLDLWLGDTAGVELGAELRRLNPDVRLVALTASVSAEQVAAAVSTGFTGWVSKDVTLQDLVAVIRGVHAGSMQIPSDLLAAALRWLAVQGADRQETERRLRSLSVREQQVLTLLASGLDRRGIGRRLYISPNTVRTHQQHILSKLDVHSVLGAVALVRATNIHNDVGARSR